jgi:hypothetical protein
MKLVIDKIVAVKFKESMFYYRSQIGYKYMFEYKNQILIYKR